MADNSGGEGGGTGAPPMETVIEMSEPRGSDTNTNTNAVGDDPKVIIMDAISVPDESKVSEEIKAMLDNMHTDPYSEDEAELRFLHSKPTCFIIVGKPGVGKSTLARRFAQEWKCELINSTELILQNMELQTEMGQRCVEILTRGEAVPEDLVLKIVQEKIDSPEVAHHGYVLDDFPCMSEATMTIKDQVELIKSWKLKPDFIINVKMPDNDLQRRRLGQKLDPMNGELYTREVYAPEKPLQPPSPDKDDEEEEEEDEAEDEEEAEESEDTPTELPLEVLERLIRRPEDMQPQVDENLNGYKDNMLRILEDYMADHNQQYLVEMDGNQAPGVLFKQLLQKLNCFVIRPAAVPIRLHDAEEEEIPEEVETDELMRTLASKQMVAPRFRWRRSRWLRFCPVSLYDGNRVLGKPEFAVSFLDKIYCLSSPEAMEKFLKNPRPYLLPPQPRPPCKLAVLGPPLSGKTTLCHLLAHKYGAKVLKVEEIIKPRMAEEKRKMVQQVREDTTETAIQAVKTKLKEQAEAEAAAREEAARLAAEAAAKEAEERAAAEAAAAEEEGEEGEEKEGEERADSQAGSTKEETEAKEEEAKAEATEEAEAKPEEAVVDSKPPPPPEPEVDATHPEVIAMVEAAVADAEKQAMTLPAEVIVEVMEAAIAEVEKNMRIENPAGPMNGGWILDNFPSTRDLWNAAVDKNLLPDDVITLNDNSDNGTCLAKRYYTINRDTIDAQIQTRLQQEEEERRRKAEEKRLREEEERRIAEEEARLAAEEERRRRIEEGEEVPEEGEEGGEAAAEAVEKEEEKEEKESQGEEAAKDEAEATEAPEARDSPDVAADTEDKTSAEVTDAGEEPAQPLADGAADKASEGDGSGTAADPQPLDALPAGEEAVPGEGSPVPSADDGSVFEELPPSNEIKIPDGPEMEPFYRIRQDFEKEFNNVSATIAGSTSIEPFVLDLDGKMVEALLEEAVGSIEKPLCYQGWENTGMDMDEEEEDMEADAAVAEEEEEEEAEAEEEDPNRSKKKPLGETNYFCPVALKDTGILFPGNPEIAARFREKVFYMSTNEARDKFLANTQSFLPKDKPLEPPPLRLLILGARGSGKTLHGRHLAEKLGLFHICFKERLQELIIAKTKKKIGPEFEEDNEEEEEEEPESEDEDEEKKEEEGEEKTGSPETDKEAAPPAAAPAAPAEGETEEEEAVELSEEEEAIKTSLESTEGLAPEILDNIVPQWWNKEPFKSTGFVLEGFPRTADEARYLSEMGLFPDAALIMTVSDGDVIGRLLPPKLDKWRVKRDKRLAKRAKKKEKAKKKRDAAIQKRREELTKERDQARAERAAEKAAMKGDDSEEEDVEEEEEEEEDEEDDIEAILAEEFEEEEEEEEEDEELEEDATERMRNDLNEVYDDDTNRLESVQETLEEILIPKLDVDAGRKPHIVRYIINKRLRPYVEFRHSIFERVYTISERLAHRMIQTGYKQPSRFGRWCPVKLKEGECIQPMSGAGFTTFPCIYRQHIYYLSSKQTRDSFLQDPMTYLTQPSPKPVVPVRLAIIGPPKSGKTTLAKRFEQEYGVMRLSVGEAMRLVLTSQPHSELARTMNRALLRGMTVSEELQVQALETVMLDMRCQTRGYVLDGFPMTKRQMELMDARSIIPVRIIHLDLDSKDVMVRGIKDRLAPTRTLPLHDSAQILQMKLVAFKKNVPPILEWYDWEHMNVVNVDAAESKWWVWDRTMEATAAAIIQIQTYLQRIEQGKAASVADMCITPKEFQGRKGDFGEYCPVSLSRGELVDCSTTRSLKYAAEFRGHYYKMAGQKELEQFLAEPEKYVPPLAPNKLPQPELLPRRCKKEELTPPKTVELQGYCPVTFLDGKCRYEAIVPGDPEMIVEYRDKFFSMESEEKLLKFMSLPEKYWDLQLPHKLPPRKEPLPVTGLPMLGYMEQGVASALIAALTAAGNFKPKYPFISSSRSALLYVAYHLKAFNPKSSDYVRKKYKQKLQKFEETCNLIRYLGDNMTVRYRDPNERPADFDSKLEIFFALRGIEPTATWIS